MSVLRRCTVATTLGAAAVLAVRPRLMRWGATDDEVQGPFPGDGLVPDAMGQSTMAVTIDAPPAAVWPWLVQMGFDRAGWYSWDRLDRGGEPSAEGINEAWQHLEVGDRLYSTRNAESWFDVAEIEPERALVLRASLGVPNPRPFDPAGPRPRFFSDSTWAFRLEPLPGNSTRLAVRTRGVVRPRAMQLVNCLVWDPAHWIMQTRQFAGIKRRAEHGPRPIATAPIPSVPHDEQRSTPG